MDKKLAKQSAFPNRDNVYKEGPRYPTTSRNNSAKNLKASAQLPPPSSSPSPLRVRFVCIREQLQLQLEGTPTSMAHLEALHAFA